ncbi:MAG: hypothetical protein BWK80_38170 [Desulfobacteraceae bacterium IS3]|nr:MAG: hypothetical protein BWK80_38170 [Desulfobacteraceae bacterium IS3]
MTNLSSEEYVRYNRQIILPEVGEEGQKKIRNARVFIAGVGGLGSVSAYYMAAAGVGYISIADRDRVNADNLNRQILHHSQDIGKPKTASALEKLRQLNPHCHIRAVQEDMREENITELVGDSQLILDATDNAETRRLLNRASVSKHIPFVYGGINGLNGMVTTFIPGETACFECLFPHKAVEKTSVAVLGPVAGLTASVQSMEALKLILGMGGLLKNRLLYIQCSDMTFREINIRKNPECNICNAEKRGVI